MLTRHESTVPMLFPYNTDAPIYYWPYATVSLIIVNIVVLLGQYSGDINTLNWVLRYDDGLHPAQWLTANFLHYNATHLLVNMFFLWTFGLVVEGKVGWQRFWLIYMGIGVIHGASVQSLMVFLETSVMGSLGSSAILFGLLGIACVWAPRNDVSCLIFVVPRISISILVFGVLMVVKEFLFVFFDITGGSELLHLFGAIIGVLVGLVMLKLNLVDCEGLDLASLLRGRTGQLDEDLFVDASQPPTCEMNDFQRQALQIRFRQCIQSGNPKAALELRHKLSQQDPPQQLDARELAALIAALHKQRLWRDSAPLMAEYADRFPQNADRVRIKLAHICLSEFQRPSRALDLLKAIDASCLPIRQRQIYQQLVVQAKKMQQDGMLELDDDLW